MKRAKRAAPLALSLSLLCVPAAAQSLGAPRQAPERTVLLPLDQIQAVQLAPIAYSTVIKEDLDREREGLAPRFAIPTDCAIGPDTEGTWENLGSDQLVWRLRIQAPGSLNLNLGFRSFHLPASASLHVYSADRTHVVRPFTARDNEAHGELWTPVVATDDLVCELVVDAAEAHEVRLELNRISQGYRPFGAPGSTFLGSGSCNVDVVCAEGDDWRLEIPSVGVISTGGSTFCTGFLVNNVRQDLKPFFMTADHCGVGSGNAASLVVYWNFENSTCREPGSPGAGGNGDGSQAQFNTGSFYRSEYAPSDFTLVELDDEVDPAFDVSYAGWDATGANATQAIAIHHPDTDEKRISFEFQPTTTTTYLQEPVPGNGTHERVEDWDVGTTEPGSSGSPLFNQDHRVIGQLHGGFASCSSQTSDWYGKFSVSWTGGGTSSSRLSNWLDPDGTGTLVIDTVSLNTLCTDLGTFSLDRAAYRCDDTLTISLADCGLNTNDTLVETVVVTVDSPTEPGGETVILTETGVRTARFVGSLGVSVVNAAGVLQVSAGDAVTLRYTDADDGMGGTSVPVTLSAPIDCSPPAILGVSVSNLEPDGATITVTSSESAIAGADLGTVCGAPTQVATGTEAGLSSQVVVTGLLPDTTYYFHALATDEAGNPASDDNGGACYSFTTQDVPAKFTEEFVGDADLSGTLVMLKPHAGPDGYTVCTRTTAGLASDPAGGTVLSLSDDGSQLITVGGGRTVKLHGQEYSSFYVNANGNLTFLASDGDYTETLDEHFGEPRVSVYWDDFNPTAGGTISWKQFHNRVTVTWEDVPEYNTTNQNTFQVDLFFGGPIRFSYSGMASTDGISGVSDGLGLTPDFFEVDLSAQANCGSGLPPEGRRVSGGVQEHPAF